MTIATAPTQPNQGMTRTEFNAAVAAWFTWWAASTAQLNADIAALEAAAAGFTSGTSATSFTFASGSKAFTIAEAGRFYWPGTTVVIARTSDPIVSRTATVLTWDGTTLTVDVASTGSAGGPFTDWRISATGAPGTAAVATTAEYLANTAGKLLSTDQVWGAGTAKALTDGANIAVDMSLGIDFSVTLGGNRVFDNPTNAKMGQTGCFFITQDGTGTRIPTWGTSYEAAGGIASIVLSTAAGAKDMISYKVQSATSVILTGVQKAVA